MDAGSDGSPILVDLFCGAGGLSHGLAQAGFTPAVGIDFDKVPMATYRLNHPDAVTYQQDISTVTAKEIKDAVGGRSIDLVAGGPSCQAYSTVGKRIEDDPRNFLFKHFVRLVQETRPKFFLMENVKGLLTFRKGHFRKLIEDSFAKAGYKVISRVLCAADYGVPQRRNRIVFLGTRLDVPLSFPEATHAKDDMSGALRPYVTVQDAIGDLPLLNGDLAREKWKYSSSPQTDYQRYSRAQSRAQYVTLHQANGPSESALRVIEHVAEGQGVRSVPDEFLPPRFQKMRKLKNGNLRKDCTTLYHRLSRNSPAYTITCYFRNVASGPFVHPLENRSLSYREATRLMSFPDNYEFCSPMLTRQIGNAVPPLLARALGSHVLELLAAHEGSSLNHRTLSPV